MRRFHSRAVVGSSMCAGRVQMSLCCAGFPALSACVPGVELKVDPGMGVAKARRGAGCVWGAGVEPVWERCGTGRGAWWTWAPHGRWLSWEGSVSSLEESARCSPLQLPHSAFLTRRGGPAPPMLSPVLVISAF